MPCGPAAVHSEIRTQWGSINVTKGTTQGWWAEVSRPGWLPRAHSRLTHPSPVPQAHPTGAWSGRGHSPRALTLGASFCSQRQGRRGV